MLLQNYMSGCLVLGHTLGAGTQAQRKLSCPGEPQDGGQTRLINTMTRAENTWAVCAVMDPAMAAYCLCTTSPIGCACSALQRLQDPAQALLGSAGAALSVPTHDTTANHIAPHTSPTQLCREQGLRQAFCNRNTTLHVAVPGKATGMYAAWVQTQLTH